MHSIQIFSQFNRRDHRLIAANSVCLLSAHLIGFPSSCTSLPSLSDFDQQFQALIIACCKLFSTFHIFQAHYSTIRFHCPF